MSCTSGSQATIIVVNDDPIQAGAMVGYLEHAGYRALEFHGVTEALGHMQGQTQGQTGLTGVTPELIVTDLHMPEIDGWRFCRLLRSPEFSFLNAVPIIIVSATYKDADTARIAADLGASAFLPAPVDPGAFLEVVGRVLLGDIVPPQPHMLLVDDDRVFCKLALRLFEAHGYKLDVAQTGGAAIKALHVGHYDLALLDYHLPEIMGDDLLVYCRKYYPEMACVMITGDTQPDLALKFMRAGAAAYVRRPCDLQYLLHVCDGARRERSLFRAEALLDQRTRELLATTEKLRQQNALLEGILDNVPDTMSVKGPDLRVIRYNQAGYDLLNLPHEQVVGKKCHDLIGRDEPCSPCATLEAVRIGSQSSVEHYFPEWDKYFHCQAKPVFGEDGRVVYAVELIQDITRRKQAEKELIQAKEAAEAANVTKSRFLANMSHELRTPLNGMLGMLQLMRMGELGEKEREFADIAIQSCHRLTRLLSDILDISKLEENVLSLGRAPFDFRAMIQDVFHLFELSALQRGLGLVLDVDPACPETVVGDPIRLQQVLTNLLGNALKFTSQGEIRLEVRPLPAPAPSQTRLLFSVSDTGIGIPDEQLPLLFKPFTQADDSYTRPYQGAGLGLSISKRLVKMMGGGISVESEPGQGSTFHIRLDLSLPGEVAATGKGMGTDTGTNICTGTGNAASRKATIPETGTKTEPEAATENRLLPSPKTSPNDASPAAPKSSFDPPRCILVVEDEPINRMVLSQQLRKLGYAVETADDGRPAVAMALKKPFDAILMDIQMPEMDGMEATRRIRAAEVHGSRFNGSTVGESADDCAVVGAKNLSPAEVAPNAPSPDTTPPPTVDREPLNREPRHTPIIAVTAHAMVGDREKFLASGMDAYLAKPVSLNDLVRTLEEVWGEL